MDNKRTSWRKEQLKNSKKTTVSFTKRKIPTTAIPEKPNRLHRPKFRKFHQDCTGQQMWTAAVYHQNPTNFNPAETKIQPPLGETRIKNPKKKITNQTKLSSAWTRNWFWWENGSYFKVSSSSSALVWWSGGGEDCRGGFGFGGWSMKAR